jgi:hypothetical protein
MSTPAPVGGNDSSLEKADAGDGTLALALAMTMAVTEPSKKRVLVDLTPPVCVKVHRLVQHYRTGHSPEVVNVGLCVRLM